MAPVGRLLYAGSSMLDALAVVVEQYLLRDALDGAAKHRAGRRPHHAGLRRPVAGRHAGAVLWRGPAWMRLLLDTQVSLGWQTEHTRLVAGMRDEIRGVRFTSAPRPRERSPSSRPRQARRCPRCHHHQGGHRRAGVSRRNAGGVSRSIQGTSGLVSHGDMSWSRSNIRSAAQLRTSRTQLSFDSASRSSTSEPSKAPSETGQL